MIRASNPQPGAWTTHNGSELKVYDSRLSEGGGGPGEVIALDDDGFEVAAGTSAIRIKRVRADGGKLSAKEYADSTGLKVGDELG